MSENTSAFVVQLLYPLTRPAHCEQCEVPLRINTKLDPLLSIPSAVQAAHNTKNRLYKVLQNEETKTREGEGGVPVRGRGTKGVPVGATFFIYR
jgi:hypothetical protein